MQGHGELLELEQSSSREGKRWAGVDGSGRGLLLKAGTRGAGQQGDQEEAIGWKDRNVLPQIWPTR